MENSATFFGNILTIISCLAAFEALRLNGALISCSLKRSQGKARETFDKFSLGALMRKYFKIDVLLQTGKMTHRKKGETFSCIINSDKEKSKYSSTFKRHEREG